MRWTSATSSGPAVVHIYSNHADSQRKAAPAAPYPTLIVAARDDLHHVEDFSVVGYDRIRQSRPRPPSPGWRLAARPGSVAQFTSIPSLRTRRRAAHAGMMMNFLASRRRARARVGQTCPTSGAPIGGR
jgi:hypothetical protein